MDFPVRHVDCHQNPVVLVHIYGKQTPTERLTVSPAHIMYDCFVMGHDMPAGQHGMIIVIVYITGHSHYIDSSKVLVGKNTYNNCGPHGQGNTHRRMITCLTQFTHVSQKTAMKYYWYWFLTYFVVQVCVAALLPLDWHVGRYYGNVIPVTPVLLVSNDTEKSVDDLKS